MSDSALMKNVMRNIDRLLPNNIDEANIRRAKQRFFA